ncbi:biorientation of chromosomes in cell division protein 1-like 1 [Harmonia axyridis]|uniref:biorientation of chromosomes in cell division protein 1-like 1 n=1 Tax=Harmonia axyridis TaxID=115357 RepID=UPI001E27503E|nr:biorientation of chromosomes in cell division protein 1-like 1 [Harmonia axyridis]
MDFSAGDPKLVEQIMKELKSQGIFDQFRKRCISDVVEKPAYQNLKQSVEGSALSFLKGQTWNPKLNKNEVREKLRNHIHESDFVEAGIERIVDQVVSAKMNSIFLPKVDDVMYKFLGIDRPKAGTSSLEENADQASFSNNDKDLLQDGVKDLPKYLEAISLESPEEKSIMKKEIDRTKKKISKSEVKREIIVIQENSNDSQSSILSGISSIDSKKNSRESLTSLNSSSETKISCSENKIKIDSEGTSSSQRSSDSNSTEEIPKKSSEEGKSKHRHKKRQKHDSKSKTKSEEDTSKAEKSERDGKIDDIRKYKIPKISDRNKDKEDKNKLEKVKSEKNKRSDKGKKYDEDKKSNHSSETYTKGETTKKSEKDHSSSSSRKNLKRKRRK